MIAAGFAWLLGFPLIGISVAAYHKMGGSLLLKQKEARSYKRQRERANSDLKQKTDEYDALSTKHAKVLTAIQRLIDGHVNRWGQDVTQLPDKDDRTGRLYDDPILGLDEVGRQIEQLRSSLRSKGNMSYCLAKVMSEQVASALQTASFLLDVKKMIRQYDQLDAHRAKIVQQVVALVGAWDDSCFQHQDQPMMSFDLVELFQANTRPDVVEPAIKSMVDTGVLPADSATPRSWETQLINFGTHELVMLTRATLAFEARFRHQIRGMKKCTSGRISPPELNSYEWHSAILGMDSLLMELASDQEQIEISVGRRMNGVWLLDPLSKNLIHLDQELIDKGYLREQVYDHAGQICLTLFELCRTNHRVLPRFSLVGQDKDKVYLSELPDSQVPRVGGSSSSSYDLARIWGYEK